MVLAGKGIGHAGNHDGNETCHNGEGDAHRLFGLFVVAVLQGRCGGKTNHGTVHEGIEIDSNLGDEKGDEGRQVTDYVQFFFRDADEIAGKEEPKGQVSYKGEPC